MTLARAAVRALIHTLVLPLGVAALAVGLLLRGRGGDAEGKPRLLWGTTPIKSLTYLAAALRQAGYVSETAVRELYPIVAAADFDHLVFGRSGNPLLRAIGDDAAAYLFFARALRRYDVFHYYFDGGVLRNTALGRFELRLLRLAGKRIVLLPYGSDSFVFDRIDNLLWRHALMIDYGFLGDRAEEIERRVRRGVRQADVVVGCLFHVTCLPRWDVLPLTCYPVDTDRLRPAPPTTDGPVRIAHAANHRGVKGTEFVIDAVERLRADGVDVELILIEGRPNDEALELVAACDLYVDQLVAAYALAALEAMALGKVTISPVEDTDAYRLFRRYSYLDECPIVPAVPETIYEVLSDLLARRAEWPSLGEAGRRYVERWHSYEAAVELWTAIYRRIWDREEVDLINFYHPLHRRSTS